MMSTASKNQVVNQSRFSFQQKSNQYKNAYSVADLALKKYEDELKSGRKYNEQMLDLHAGRCERDE